MKAVGVISACIAVFVTLPIWLWLVYQILVRIDASELMWFLYWIYLPASLFVAIVRMAVVKTPEGKTP